MNKPAGSALSHAIAGRFDGIEQGVAFGWALAPRELQSKLGIELLDGDTVVAAGGCATRQANGIEALWTPADDAWQRNFGVNLGGPRNICRAVLPLMIGQRWGRIINFSGIAPFLGGSVTKEARNASKQKKGWPIRFI